MSYSPNNVYVYLQAFSGAVAGLLGQSKSLVTTPRGANTDTIDIAGAWAQEVDAQWGVSTNPDLFEYEEILNFSTELFQAINPQPSSRSTSPATYTSTVEALIVLLEDGEAYLSSQGITPPSIATGVTLENDGTPLAGGPFTTLNLEPGLTATDAGSGVANISTTFPLRPLTAYGALADGVITSGSIGGSSSSLSVDAAGASAGMSIRINGAGIGGVDLLTTIREVASASMLILADAAATGVVGAQVVFGTDNSPAFARAAEELSGSSIGLWFDGPGIFCFASYNDVTSRNLLLWGESGTTLCSLFGPDGTGHFALLYGLIYDADPAFSAVPLTADVVLASNQFAVATAPSVGDRVRLTTDQIVQLAAYYTVQSVVPSGPDFLVTVDRPIWAPFTASGATATVVDRILVARTTIRLYGNGMVITGTGSRHIQIFGGLDCVIDGVRFDESGGYLSGGAYANSYDEGSTNCCYSVCVANIPHNISPFTFEGLGEGNRILNCSVEACSAQPLSLVDQYAAVVSGFRGIGGTGVGTGIYVTTNHAWKCIDCTLMGVSAESLGTGILLDASLRTTLVGCAADANGGNGIALSANPTSGLLPVGTMLLGCRATQNYNNGLLISAGAKSTQYRAFDGSENANGGVGSAIRASDDCEGEGLVSAGGSATGNSAIIMQLGGTGRHRDASLTLDWATPATFPSAIYVTGATCEVSGTVSLAATTPAKTALNIDVSSKVTVDDFVLSGTGTGNTGIALASGSTLRMGDNVNVQIAATPTSFAGGSHPNRGSVAANGATPVAVAFPDLRTTDNVMLQAAGGSPTAWLSAFTPGTGFSLTATAGDTGSYDYVIR